ncbi:winged helix-turn-helix domain-containing protein [Paucidesulfovibrio longus]|uniref:winged helix-turn-helix domain-containing protein n=1 Tax=Paucidesulfovibrio longus TaxID=889 RepID=UPI0003B5D94C|nr:LysR family transcriptional regulator [Paucidesulfovibrio longus]
MDHDDQNRTAATGRQRPSSRNAVIRMHLWLESPDGVLFGMGRLLLLREIRNSGSLTAAAANLGMSYRGAWGKIKKTEELLGEQLIERNGCRRSGYRLTPFGETLSARFEEWFRAVESFAFQKSCDILPIKTQPFSGRK